MTSLAEIEMNRRILLIDDNQDIHRDLTMALAAEPDDGRSDDLASQILGTTPEKAEQLEYAINSAYQGEQGFSEVEAAREAGRPYAVAVVDMRMPPGWDGLETIDRIFGCDPQIQVVLCTAFSDHDWDTIQERLGVTDRLLILKKPIEEVEIRQIASALTEKWNLAEARRAAEEHLGSLATQTEMILASSAEGMLCVGADGIVTYANPAALEMLGVVQDDVLGRVPHGLLHPDGFCEASCALAETHGGHQAWRSREQRFRSSRDGDRMMECAYTPALRADGGLGGAVLAFRDVTQERDQEAKILHNQKLESIGSLASGIAHEINTPAQYVTDSLRFLDEATEGLCDLATRGQALAGAVQSGETIERFSRELLEVCEALDLPFLTENAPDSVKRAQDGIRRITEIVRAINEYSHPGTGELSPVDPNRIVETAVAVAAGQWKHVARVEMDLASEIEPVPGHAGELSQVFVNLLVNACQAIESAKESDPERAGEITIRTRNESDHVEVVIQDNGCGLPESLRGRIFEPFFTTKGVGKGTGQGLAIARSIITQHHHGSIDCGSQDGEGTRFEIRLPRVTPKED